MTWIADQICGLLFESTYSGLKGLLVGQKKYRVRKKLVKRLEGSILEKYGNEVFYNHLDGFLSESKFIIEILKNCEAVPPGEYKSKSVTVDYYIGLFHEEYPCYPQYRKEIRSLIMECFNVIYTTLNGYGDDESVRIICSVVQEVIGEQTARIGDMIKRGNKNLGDKLDILIKENEKQVNFFRNQYIDAQVCLYTKEVGYINRTLYHKEIDEATQNNFEVLLEERKVLLLGEAGFGKTYESLNLLKRVCECANSSELVPIYLPLCEYGLLYDSIIDGIKCKLLPFGLGDWDKLIADLLKQGCFVLILDGADDISNQKLRNKFYADAKNININYQNVMMFVTSRANRYSEEFGGIKKYSLKGIGRDVIRRQLSEEGITTQIPEKYYQLFENPMFFDVGKKILKKSQCREIFNRNALFEELFLLLCGEWDKKKGLHTESFFGYDEILNTLGYFSYVKFEEPSSSLLEFSEIITKSVASKNCVAMIDKIIGSGIIVTTDRVIFKHKLFKEYCTAYYLVNNYPLLKNKAFYSELVNKEAWKEVFIFATGMFKSLDNQDLFLDFIMENNLALYVECINAKSDLGFQSAGYENVDYASRFLSTIHKTYTFIIDKYFEPIRNSFDPVPGRNEKNICRKKVKIVGCITNNGKYLSYWFERAEADELDVLCLNDNEVSEYHKRHRRKAADELKNIQSHYIDLKLSGLEGDSSRLVAINKIKSEISSLLERRELIESKYLLTERLVGCRKKVKYIEKINDLGEMYAKIDCIIKEFEEKVENLVGFDSDGVDLFYLRSLLKIMLDNNIDWNECILPEMDKTITGTSGWVWDLYSDQCKIERVSRFFHFHHTSYIEMIQTNFPNLCSGFRSYKDFPYKTVILLYLKKDKSEGEFSEPSITYYHIASSAGFIELPEIRVLENEHEYNDYPSKIDSEIRQSYELLGKEAQRTGYVQIGFTATTSPGRFLLNTPLSDFVYRDIQYM